MTVFLVDAPANTVTNMKNHANHTSQPIAIMEVRDWLIEKNIRTWSIFTEDDGKVKFIFIDQIHAMLFRLRWS